MNLQRCLFLEMPHLTSQCCHCKFPSTFIFFHQVCITMHVDIVLYLLFIFSVHNRISEVLAEQLLPYSSLESLDLSSNSISELKAGSFPPMQLKYLWVFVLGLVCVLFFHKTVKILRRLRELSEEVILFSSYQFENSSISCCFDRCHWKIDVFLAFLITFVVHGYLSVSSLHHDSNLSKNKISSLEPGCLGNLSSLLVLKINQNRLSLLPDKVFTLSQLQVLCVFMANEKDVIAVLN